MNKKAFICIAATLVILSGCGNSKTSSEETNNTQSTGVTQSETTKSPAESTPEPKKKKLSASEKLALNYVEIFLNGSDLEAKKKFVVENIHPDVQAIFKMAESTETSENNKLKNPAVVESVDYKDADGKKDKLVLVQGEKASSKNEVIIFIKEDKVGWGYSSDDNEAFNKVRKLFKEPMIITADSGNTSSAEASPDATLQEISNFIVSDIWNVGFVDISWYASSGTSSTGQTLDIDFTIEQLGKAMNQKKEYDTYISNLDAKYDSIKGIWSKLSGEIDRMYKQIQDKPPIANDSTTKLDTGVFTQYLEAFTDEVDKLPNS